MAEPWSNQGYGSYQQGAYGTPAQQPLQVPTVDQQYGYGAAAQQSATDQSARGTYGSGYNVGAPSGPQAGYSGPTSGPVGQRQQGVSAHAYGTYQHASAGQPVAPSRQNAEQHDTSSYAATSTARQTVLPGINDAHASAAPAYGQQQQQQQTGHSGVPYGGPPARSSGSSGDSNSKLQSIIAQASSLAAAQQQQQATPLPSAHYGAQQQGLTQQQGMASGYGSNPHGQGQAGHRGSDEYPASAATTGSGAGYATGTAAGNPTPSSSQYMVTQPHYSSANRGGGAAEGFGRAAEGGGSAGGTLPGLSDNGASKLYEPPQHHQQQQQQQQGGFGMAAAGSVSPYGQHATRHGGPGAYDSLSAGKASGQGYPYASEAYGTGGGNNASGAGTTGGAYNQSNTTYGASGGDYGTAAGTGSDPAYGGGSGNSGNASAYGGTGPQTAAYNSQTGGPSDGHRGSGGYNPRAPSDGGYGSSTYPINTQQSGGISSSGHGSGGGAAAGAPVPHHQQQQQYPGAHDRSHDSSIGGAYGAPAAYGQQQQQQPQQPPPQQPRQSRFSPAPHVAAPQPPTATPPSNAHGSGGAAFTSSAGYGSAAMASAQAQPPVAPRSYGPQTPAYPAASKPVNRFSGASAAAPPHPTYGQVAAPAPPAGAPMHRAILQSAAPPHGGNRTGTYGRGGPPDGRHAFDGASIAAAPPSAPAAPRGGTNSHSAGRGFSGGGSRGPSGGRGFGSERQVPQSLASAVALAQGSSDPGHERSRSDARGSSKAGGSGASDRRDDRDRDRDRTRDRDRRPRSDREGREPSRRDTDRHRDPSHDLDRNRHRGREDREPRSKKDEVPLTPPPPPSASNRPERKASSHRPERGDSVHRPERGESSHQEHQAPVARRRAASPARAIEYGIKVPSYEIAGARCGYAEAFRRYPNASLSHDLVSIVPCWHHPGKRSAPVVGQLGCSLFALEGAADSSHEVDYRLQTPLRPPLTPASDGIVYSAKVLLSVGLGGDGRKAFLNGPAHGGDTLHRLLKFVTMRTEKAQGRSGIQAPGGIVDPAIDGDPTKGDRALMKAAVRGVSQQLGLELPWSEGWTRLVELHYLRAPEHGSDRLQREVTVFFVTDLASALPSAAAWPAAWERRQKWLADKATHHAAVQEEKEKKKEKEKEKEKERSSKKAEKEGGDVQTKASTDAATSQSDDKKDKPEAGSAKDGSDGPPATKPTLKEEAAGKLAESSEPPASDRVKEEQPPLAAGVRGAEHVARDGPSNGAPVAAGEQSEAVAMQEEPKPPPKPSLMFVGRRSEGKVWRSQAISLDGLLDYEEGDREEGTVELSLAAEALQEALAATFASTLADHLVNQRATRIASRRKHEKENAGAEDTPAARGDSRTDDDSKPPTADEVQLSEAPGGTKRAVPEPSSAEAQSTSSKRVKTEGTAGETNEAMEEDMADKTGIAHQDKSNEKAAVQTKPSEAAVDFIPEKKIGAAETTSPVGTDTPTLEQDSPPGSAAAGAPAEKAAEAAGEETSQKAVPKKGGRKPAAKKAPARKRPARKTKAALKAENEAAATVTVTSAAATEQSEDKAEAMGTLPQEGAHAEAGLLSSIVSQAMDVDSPTGTTPAGTFTGVPNIKLGTDQDGETVQASVDSPEPIDPVSVQMTETTQKPAEARDSTSATSPAAAIASGASPANPADVKAAVTDAAKRVSPSKDTFAAGAEGKTELPKQGEASKDGQSSDQKDMIKGKDKDKEKAPKKEYIVDESLLATCRYFDRTGAGWIKVEDLRRLLHILARDDLPHWLVKEASVLLVQDSARAATRSSRIAFRDIYSQEVQPPVTTP